MPHLLTPGGHGPNGGTGKWPSFKVGPASLSTLLQVLFGAAHKLCCMSAHLSGPSLGRGWLLPGPVVTWGLMIWE